MGAKTSVGFSPRSPAAVRPLRAWYISRREFLDGAQNFAVGGVTAAALFEMLRPNYTWAIQVQKNDSRIKSETVTVPSPQGYGSIKG
jgi:carboxymethylenebutenolidase